MWCLSKYFLNACCGVECLQLQLAGFHIAMASSTEVEKLPGSSKVAGIWPKKFKKFRSSIIWIMFLMVEMDSTISKTSGAPKILKFDSCNLDLQKSLPDFIKILPKFPWFSRQICRLVRLRLLQQLEFATFRTCNLVNLNFFIFFSTRLSLGWGQGKN